MIWNPPNIRMVDDSVCLPTLQYGPKSSPTKLSLMNGFRAATFASRSGIPIGIVSKLIVRHAHLSTTQRYLGKVADVEAMRWIENLYG